MLHALLGDWHVCRTNFPMWLRGDKTQPQFHYTATADPRRMRDVVSYLQAGRRRTIRGTDRQTGAVTFRWRGEGWLRLFTSHWTVEHFAADGQWAVIAFEKSLVSPRGYDIICRTHKPSPATVHAMLAKFAQLHPGVELHRPARTPRTAPPRSR